MQSAIPTPHTLTDILWYAVATFLATSLSGGTVATIITIIVNRKKPAAEIHESEARTARSLAEVRSLDLQTNISAGDAVLRMVQQLTFAQGTIERLHKDVERLEEQIEAQNVRAASQDEVIRKLQSPLSP